MMFNYFDDVGSRFCIIVDYCHVYCVCDRFVLPVMTEMLNMVTCVSELSRRVGKKEQVSDQIKRKD